jgi:nitrate/nitrite transporter NarK
VGEPQDPDRGRALDPDDRGTESLPDGYLDIYKLAVEMADRVSARRALASTFFLTALSSLIVVMGLTTKDDWAFALPGLILAVTWWLLIRSYRLLNRAKFKVIHKMEERLPLRPFTDEWPITEMPPKDELVRFRRVKALQGRYAELGVLEQTVPTVFSAIFLVILVTSWG